MEKRRSSGTARHLSNCHRSAYNNTTLFVAMVAVVTALAIVRVACEDHESDPELVAERHTPSSIGVVADDYVAGSDENVTMYPNIGEENVCLRRHIIRLLLKLVIVRQVSVSPREGDTNANAGSTTDTIDGKVTAEELDDICKELCKLGLCPPGCGDNYAPPLPSWG